MTKRHPIHLNFHLFRRLLSSLLMLVMLFNSTASVLAAAWITDDAQQYAGEDKILICTGSSFKWISESAFFESNQLVFVDAPADAPAELQQIDCSYKYLSDLYTDLPNMLDSSIDHIAYQALNSRLAQRPYTAFAYQSAHSRAPPLL
ncbi:hypothetical protein QX776_10000 [Alteromonadaceae bacterium BrNp21-10]|nr:hypothetical protein [Alteromonadaceae bacterium BrNp21-10]